MQLHELQGWRALNGRPRLRVAVCLQVKVYGRGLSLQPIGCTPARSVTQKAPLQLQLRLMALYKCCMPLPLPYDAYRRFAPHAQ